MLIPITKYTNDDKVYLYVKVVNIEYGAYIDLNDDSDMIENIVYSVINKLQDNINSNTPNIKVKLNFSSTMQTIYELKRCFGKPKHIETSMRSRISRMINNS
jgi:hypothetical protein